MNLMNPIINDFFTLNATPFACLRVKITKLKMYKSGLQTW